MNDNLLQRLAQPFEPSAITWKPGSTKDNKCLALAYSDLRSYMDRLDEVCGLDWSCKYTPWGDGRIICELTIGGITRSSTGEADAQDEKNNLAGSVTEALGFKRAAAMWGLGRYLYSLPVTWVEFDAQRRRITEQGQRELAGRYASWYAEQMAEELPWIGWKNVEEMYAWGQAAGVITCEQHGANTLRKIVESDLGGKLTKSNWRQACELFYHNRLARKEEKEKEAA